MKFSYDITDLNIESEINNDTIKEIYKIIIDSLEKEGIDKSSYKLLALKLNNYCHIFLDALDESFPKEYQVWAFNRINLYLCSQIEDEKIKEEIKDDLSSAKAIKNADYEGIENGAKNPEYEEIRKQKNTTTEKSDDFLSDLDDIFETDEPLHSDVIEKHKAVYLKILKILYDDYSIDTNLVSLKEIRDGEKFYYFVLDSQEFDLSKKIHIWAANRESLFPLANAKDDDILDDFAESDDINIDYSIFKEVKFEKPKTSLKEVMLKIANVRKQLTDVVVGQDAAIDRFLSGLFDILVFKDKNKPLKGSFLFAGPPGTGKTLLAKEIAKALEMDKLIVNLSEYSDKDAICRFKGFDKTYKNSRPGLVTSYVNDNPNCVIIFDEVDKAEASVKNLLLQLYNDGYINDPQLEKDVSFKNTILIFTTNAGKALYEDTTGNLSLLSNKKIINALKNEKGDNQNPLFPASLLSRFSSNGILVFNHLEPYSLFEITKKAFTKKVKDFEKNDFAKIEFSDDLITALLYKLGGKADGRNLIGLCNKYIEDETIEALRQLDEDKLSKIKKIKFSIDTKNNEKYFSMKQTNILIFVDEKKFKSLDINIEGVKFYHAKKLDRAKELLRKDIDFIICDLETNKRLKNVYNDIEDIESEGRDLITYCNEYHSEIPLYVINDGRGNNEFATLFKIGIKGLIRSDENFVVDCTLAKNRASMARNCFQLNRENKILSYRTRQKLYDDVIEIEMYNIKFSVDYNAADDNDFVLDIDRPQVKFSDVIGSNDAKETLKDFIRYLNNPVQYLENGIRAPRGILLYGPPGTGKTLLAKALAGESTVSFIQKNASDFVGKSPDYVGELFNKARKYAPAVIFIDEVDAIAKERGLGGPSESILNKLLSELDGFKFDAKRPIIVIAATNYPLERTSINPIILDPAFVRRFDRKIKIDLPNKKERIEFLHYYLKKHSINTISDECINNIASRTVYYSPADLELLVEHALRNCNGNKLTDEILSNTVDENKNGKANEQTEKEIKTTAVHESGHALVCYLSGKTPAYVTIVSRGGYGGYMQYGDSEKNYLTKEELLAKIRVSLAGRAAEIIEFGECQGLTTGPSSDLYHATALARAIVSDYGMNDSLISLDALDIRDGGIVINAIDKILDTEFNNTKDLIIKNKDKLDILVNALLEKNSLTESEINELLN